jgi:hypothetical protein
VHFWLFSASRLRCHVIYMSRPRPLASLVDAGENLVPHNNHADTDPVAEVAQLRDRIMRDLAPVPVFARAIGKSIRAVQRMAKAGQVEIVRYGATPYVRLE